MLTRDIIRDHMRLLEVIGNTTVNVLGADWRLEHVCHKVAIPFEIAVPTEFIPCTRISVLDCFVQGGFDFALPRPFLDALPELRDDYGIGDYDSRPDFEDPDVDIHEVATGGCQGYAANVTAMLWSEDLLFGGIEHNDEGEITKAAAFETIVLLSGAKDLAERESITEDEAATVLTEWRTAFLEDTTAHIEQMESSRTYVLASDSLDRLLASVSDASAPFIVAGYAVMIGYLVFSLGKEQLAIVGLTGLTVVGIATLSSFGFTSLLGVSFNAASTQVLPFLALGIGVDDMFVLAHSLADVRDRFPEATRADHVAGTLEVAGPSVTLTSLSNFAAFMAATLIPLPAVQSFCYQAATVVAFNYLTLVITLPAAMAVLKDVGKPLCGAQNGATQPAAAASGGPKDADAEAAAANGGAATTNRRAAPASLEGRPTGGPRDSLLRRFVVDSYAPRLTTAPFKLAVSLGAVVMFVLGIVGSTQVDQGLDLEDVAPADSMEAMFLEARFKYFSFFGGNIITEDFDYPANQAGILAMTEELRANEFVMDVPETWLETFIDFVGEQGQLDDNGLVPEATFYRKLNQWISGSDSALDALLSGAEFFGFSSSGQLVGTVIPFYIHNVVTTEDFVSLIDSVRSICEESPIECFPQGVPFTFWEQYVHLLDFLLDGMLYALIAVAVVVAMVLASPYPPLVVALLVGLTVFEVYGAMGLVGIKLSAVPAVSLIMAAGVAVEFTAHLIVAFLDATGDRNERVREALSTMFIPILDGGISTFVGIVALAFSPFGFVRKYFFGIFAAVIIVGLYNGLALLPVLLSFVGPPSLRAKKA